MIRPALLPAATILVLALPFVARPGHAPTDVRRERLIDSLLQVMTIEEKVGQLVQYTGWWRDSLSGPSVSPEQERLITLGRIGGIFNLWGAKATRAAQKIAVENSRMKIPLLFGLDVIHGYRTTFPIPLAEASSWDTSMVERDARIAAAEAAASGVNWTFAPMVDIARDPRWGRIAEGSGEDPLLGSLMAAARVRGFQGDNPASDGSIAACAKHFAAYGGAEGGRDYNTVDISERTLRETYLPPYRAAVDAGALTVMSSFNEIGGVPSTANHALLTGILRNEWGFRGFVVSDWTAITELIPHGVARDTAEAAALAFNAGTDADMESGAYRLFLPRLVREGKVSPARLDEGVRNVLRVKYALGLFDDPYRHCSEERERSALLNPDHIAGAREAGRRSVVLLKNRGGVIPLSKNIRSLAVIGPLADDRTDPLGPWDAQGRPQDVVSLVDGIRHAVFPSTRLLYARGCPIVGADRSGIDAAVDAAKNAEYVILALGESSAMSGEAASRSTLDLPGVQNELMEAVAATGKPVVLVLMNGRPLAIPWAEAHISTIVETWFLGVQTGNSIADCLFGDYNPSGKLPVTFPLAVGQVPFHYNHKNTGRPPVDTMKFTSRYMDIPSSPLFPFGFGLSFTTFGYSDLTVSPEVIDSTGTVTVGVRVKNTGSRAGEEVVQLYVRQDVGSVTRPVRELKGFRKIMLAPGESRRVEFSLSGGDLVMYDAAMRRVVEPGTFTVYVGTNSRDVTEGHFSVRPSHVK
jgi:beta-glucosidase